MGDFQAITDAADTSALITEKISTMGGLFTNITTSLNDITSIDTTIPQGLLSLGSDRISPTFTIPSLPAPANPLDSITFPAFAMPEDTDIGIGGSLMSAFMAAITATVDAGVAAISDAIKQAINMFMTIIESINSILEWLKSTILLLWSDIKTTYNNWYNTMMESTGNVKRLWERALVWLDKIMKTIGEKQVILEDSVIAFVDELDAARIELGTSVTTLASSMPNIATDLNKLTQEVTTIFA